MNKARGFQNAWWLVLLTTFVIYISLIPFSVTGAENLLYLIISEIILIIPVIVGIYMIRCSENKSLTDMLGICTFPVRLVPFLLIIAPCAQIFCGFIMAPVQNIFTLLFGADNYENLIGNGDIKSFAMNFVIICVLAPLLEELLCRGILMQLFKRYGIAVMLIFSSVAFSILHQSVASFIPIFFLGLLLGVIRVTTNSLWACMIVHSASNLFSLLVLYAGEYSYILSIGMVVISMILFPLLLWKFLTKYPILNNTCTHPTAGGISLGLSVGMIISIIIFFVVNTYILITRVFSGELFYEISMLFG